MSDAADLRRLADEGAAALEAMPALEADVDRLEHDLAAARARIAELEAQLPKPANRILWGSSIQPRGVTYAQALTRVEKTLGKLDIIRLFDGPGSGPRWPHPVGDTGDRSICYSAKAPSRGKFEKFGETVAKHLEANPGVRFYDSIEHEGDKAIRDGRYNLAHYLDLWDDYLTATKPYRESGRFLSTNIFTKYALDTKGTTFADVKAMIHPDVDVHAWDPYAWNNTFTAEGMYGDLAKFSTFTGKPWAVAETGAEKRQSFPRNNRTEYGFHPAPNWHAMLTRMSRWLATADPAPEFVTYFSNGNSWVIDSDPDGAAAWKAGMNG